MARDTEFIEPNGRRRIEMWTPFYRLLVVVPAVLVVLLLARPCEAQEVTIVVGRLLGDEITEFREMDQLLRRNLEDAPVYGGRVAISGVLLSLEASVVLSPSGLIVKSDPALDVRVMYAEVDALLPLIGGPVTPFIVAGIGWHSFRFEFEDPVVEASLGYNFGAGIKLALGKLGLRADIRNHISRFDMDSVNPKILGILDLRDNQTLHNYELSTGLTISF